jgi:hypothetical protein
MPVRSAFSIQGRRRSCLGSNVCQAGPPRAWRGRQSAFSPVADPEELRLRSQRHMPALTDGRAEVPDRGDDILGGQSHRGVA